METSLKTTALRRLTTRRSSMTSMKKEKRSQTPGKKAKITMETRNQLKTYLLSPQLQPPRANLRPKRKILTPRYPLLVPMKSQTFT